jgi:hypothetical protein
MSQLAKSHKQNGSSKEPRLKGNPMHTSVQEGARLRSTGGLRTAVNLPKSTTVIIVVTILGGWILAVALAGAHHGFGLAMDNQTIPDYPKTNKSLGFHPRSQDSINSTATAFVRGVILSLAMAAGGILTQMVCIVFSAHLHVSIYIFHANMTPCYRYGVFQPSTQFHSTNSTRSSNFPLLYRLSPSSSPPSFLTSG